MNLYRLHYSLTFYELIVTLPWKLCFLALLPVAGVEACSDFFWIFCCCIIII
jgi:hypothetical protein